MRLIFLLILSSITLHSQDNVKSIDYDEYLKISKSKEFLIIDVRTQDEYQINRIKKSININFYNENFIDIFKKFEYDKNILIYCRSGRRSLEAVKILSEKGYTKLYDLKGGILGLDKSNIDFNSLNN